jgi:PAS domain S-box-containing protein
LAEEELKEEVFGKQVKVAHEHLADLKQRIDVLPDHERQPLIIEALEELSVALEELQVTSEELHQQSEELAVARKHAEVERQRYLELFDFAPEGYVVTDADGTILDANRAAAALLSVLQGYLIGKPLIVFVNEEDRKPFVTQLNNFGGLEHLEDWEIYLKPRNGEPFPAAITIGTVRDPNGKLVGLRWLIRDITERKRMDKQLRSLSERLLTIQEDERKKVAQDLHDSLGAALAAVKYNVEGVIQMLGGERGVERMITSLKNALLNIQYMIEDVRRIYTDLRPSVLDDLGIEATVKWFTREFQNVYPHMGIEKEIAIEDHAIPQRLKIILYRVIQEAFTSIAKHSKGDLIRFSLGRRGDRIEMVIKDNGVGFDAKEAILGDPRGSGPGVLGMRERVELSGGYFKIESSKGTGTVVRASWPIPS